MYPLECGRSSFTPSHLRILCLAVNKHWLKNSQRFQLLLMSPECSHCHSLGLLLFNKFTIIITSLWSNSNWSFNGTHSDKIEDRVPVNAHLETGHLQFQVCRAVQDEKDWQCNFYLVSQALWVCSSSRLSIWGANSMYCLMRNSGQPTSCEKNRLLLSFFFC